MIGAPLPIALVQNQRERFTWLVKYKDGTVFQECDESGEGRGFASVRLADVESLALIGKNPEAFTVRVPEEAEPVFFRRRRVSFAPPEEEAREKLTTHCIGWCFPHADGLPDAGVYLFVFEDGSTLVTTDRQVV